ncbi:MAG: DUF4340 domain-containing protein, partial [Acidobacteriia bacterium]|nr:DUF4340 domain-containing protein [Terriglobia bacterium]
MLIAAVLLAGLSAAVYFSNKSEAAKEGKPAADAAPKILSLDEKNVAQFEIKKRDGTDTVAKKDDSGKWSLITPAMPADQNACNAVTSAVTAMTADRVVDENATDLSSYGLAPAADTVIFTMKDGKKTTLLIGDGTPTGNNVYAKVDGDPKLYTMANFNRDSLDKDAKQLRDDNALSITSQDTPEVSNSAFLRNTLSIVCNSSSPRIVSNEFKNGITEIDLVSGVSPEVSHNLFVGNRDTSLYGL